MQFMVNVKTRFIFPIFSIFALSYLLYLFYDHSHQGNEWNEDFVIEKSLIAEKEEFTGVLLGGSNVVFSLSANQLNNETKFKWFNFGLSSEAFTDENYWRFIKENIDSKKRDKVEVVVYSSIAFLVSGYLKSREQEVIGLYGDRPMRGLPNSSLASRIQSRIQNANSISIPHYPLPKEAGDFNFDLKECIPNYRVVFERELDLIKVEKWLVAQTNFMKTLFQNAQIIIVIPSEYYGITYDERTVNQVNKNVTTIVTERLGSSVELLIQKPLKTRDITCDAKHHTNAAGREIRTQDLAIWLSDNLN